MSEQVINVGLYGGKSIFTNQETPLRAEIIYCDKFNNCSYYKNCQCLNVTAPFSNRCKYGRISVIYGYTSRAKKYHEFKSKYKRHEQYDKLDHPPRKLGLIGDEVVFPYPHISIDKELNINNDSGFVNTIAFIPCERFSVDFIKKICSFRPRSLLGNEIRDYQMNIVPLFLAHLKELLPEKYTEVKEKYPDLIQEITYVGRTALLKTINPSYVHYRSHNYPQFNEEWYWDGEFLIFKNGYVKSFSVTKDYEIVEIKIKPSEKSTIRISNNDQVSDNTVFVD